MTRSKACRDRIGIALLRSRTLPLWAVVVARKPGGTTANGTNPWLLIEP